MTSRTTARPLTPGRVTVVVPTYGHRDYVLATLDSVFAQTRPADEIIVVNDGSPDDTADVLRPLVEAKRIRYFEQENAGVSIARNVGLWQATGEFITFVDDDDLVPADRLAWQAGVLESEPQVVLVYGEHTSIKPDGTIHPPRQRELPSGWVHDDFLLHNRMISPGQALIRTAALRSIGGFDPTLWGCGDWDAYVRLARVGEFRSSKRIALHYRLHESNASRRALRHARDHLRAMSKHYQWSPWNLPRIFVHQRAVSSYYVPNLQRYVTDAKRERRRREAFRACGYMLLFRPALALRPWFVWQMAELLVPGLRRFRSAGADSPGPPPRRRSGDGKERPRRVGDRARVAQDARVE